MPEKESNRNGIAAGDQIPLEKTKVERPMSEDKKKEQTASQKFAEAMKELGVPTREVKTKGTKVIFHPKPLKKNR